MRKKTMCYLSTLAFISLLAMGAMGGDANAQDRYAECQRRAQQISGYYGPVPDSHLPGGALRGAARGAAGGAIIGGIAGKKVKTGKAAARGAAVGALVGGVRRANAKSANDRKRDAYQFEINACMSAN